MSTEHQQYSTENQSDIIRQYAESRNMEIVEAFIETGTFQQATSGPR
ncbi:MAG: recombinase family protein [Silvibacterium sp.]